MKRLFIIILIFGTVVSQIKAQNFEWAKQFAGETNSSTTIIKISESGNIFTVGTFKGTIDFDGGQGSTTLTSRGEFDLFVEKMDSDGNLLWVKQIGSTGNESVRGFTIDSDEHLYFAGSFKGITDLDPGDGEVIYTSAGDWDMYLLELDPDGNYLWSGQMGGITADYAVNIEVSPSGNIYVSGYFAGTVDFDPSSESEYFLTASYQDLFVEKLSSTKELLWAGVMGGSFIDYLQDMHIDADENIYTTGGFGSIADFDPGAGVANLSAIGDRDIFISKLNSNGEYVWAIGMGSYEGDFGQGIETDSEGNVYVCGQFSGTVDFNPSVDEEYFFTSQDEYDIFIGKFNADAEFVWMKQVAGQGNQVPYRLTLDNEENVYTTGYFEETADFNPDIEEYLLTSAGGIDMYINKLTKDGGFQWAIGIGSTENDRGFTMASNDNYLYTGGLFTGTVDFNPGDDTFELMGTGEYNAFVYKLETSYLQSVEDISNNSISVYPNPTNSFVNIDFDEIISSGEVNVYSILGKKVVSKEINNQSFVQLKLEDKKGMFFVRITYKGVDNTIKIIKE